MDEVHTWGKDFQTLQSIKGQRHRMLMDVYMGEELNKIYDWVKKIAASNKVVEILHAKINKLKDQTQEQILEDEKYYNDVCLNIFEDESRDKLMPIQVVVK